MRVETDTNLVFDDSDERCKFYKLPLRGELIRVAIVQCYDKNTGFIQQYIGKFDESKPEKSIDDIMSYGSSFKKIVKEFSNS